MSSRDHSPGDGGCDAASILCARTPMAVNQMATMTVAFRRRSRALLETSLATDECYAVRREDGDIPWEVGTAQAREALLEALKQARQPGSSTAARATPALRIGSRRQCDRLGCKCVEHDDSYAVQAAAAPCDRKRQRAHSFQVLAGRIAKMPMHTFCRRSWPRFAGHG